MIRPAAEKPAAAPGSVVDVAPVSVSVSVSSEPPDPKPGKDPDPPFVCGSIGAVVRFASCGDQDRDARSNARRPR